ncbi:MAG: hypothetical protein L6Q54_03320 [Leptospiraceae bacterium]|nr:hypothetical protein [Leptospiraceae bacterium]MCK6380267.1 hypothetical protein [Leptospiraceae bacterium]NUM41098.1 hypothetical protein [Leptospiraceae bacterium]
MNAEIRDNLVTYKLSPMIRNVLFGMMGLGILSFVIGYFVLGHETARHGHSNPAWSALLVAVSFIIGISLCGIFFTALSNITGSYWSVTVRRLTENYGRFMPVVIILLILVFIGIHDLFEWSHPEVVASDKLIKHKSAWLKTPFFVGRLIFFAVIWSFFGYFFYKRSVDQDSDKNVSHTKFSAKLSGAFIIVFALTLSVTSFDLLMSLTPHWFSTMFGVYIFGGAYQTVLASMIIFIYILKKSGYLGDYVNENHIHDIGKFLLGFTVFWAYIAFSQFMLIWYANLPEETFWYEMRLTGGWTFITILIPFVKFVIPFLWLLNRPNKRDIEVLNRISVWIVVTQILELFWIVFPANFEYFSFLSLVVTFGVTIGVIGLFGFVILKGLESAKLIPVGDPRLEESLHHHQ